MGKSARPRRQEELISVLGKGGGYILGPAHAIQAGTPADNILAMFDATLGFYPPVSCRTRRRWGRP